MHRSDKTDATALHVGYRSRKNFNHAVKQVTGLTPTAFRCLTDERAALIIESLGGAPLQRATAADRRR